MTHKRSILSTREIARYCSVNFKTVLRWIQEKRLKAYQLPGSKTNRVRLEDFCTFLDEYNMPIPGELVEKREPRILIVDDERPLCDAFIRVLRKHAFQVDVAYDGFEAGRKIESCKPDVVLLDICMPGMSGIEVLKCIKSDPKTKHIVVMIMSGNTALYDKQALRDMGAYEVIEKPFDIQTVVERITACVHKKETCL